MASGPFNAIQGNSPGRTLFDLSYAKKFDFDMGLLIPICCEEALPNDVWNLGNSVVIRFNPLVAPILHQVDVFVHYFFDPFRLLWPRDHGVEALATTGWETFYTGGQDGNLAPAIPTVTDNGPINKGGFWDYIGLPTGVTIPSQDSPIAFPALAYRHIWNEYYRDPNLQAALDIYDSSDAAYSLAAPLLSRAWEKDYFTSALPWQQRGDPPALPNDVIFNILRSHFTVGDAGTGVLGAQIVGEPGAEFSINGGSGDPPGAWANAFNTMLNGSVSSTGFDVSDLRLAVQIQRWLELSARSGPRFTDALRAHFNASPSDSRLQRPEYIGGIRYPLIVSEVLQTSSTDATSPQGNMAGHGITANGGNAGRYRVQEHGLIMGLLSVIPKTTYQQGLPRWLSRRSRFDFYSPEFAHLSEQAILEKELFLQDDTTDNNTIFGYQAHWDEYRTRQDMVCNNFRDTLDYWHLGRQFATPPSLNGDFIQCSPRKDIFAVQNVPGMLCNFGNRITCSRAMPALGTPGMLDHVF